MTVRAYVVACLVVTFWVTLLPRKDMRRRYTSVLHFRKGDKEKRTALPLAAAEWVNITVKQESLNKSRPVSHGDGEIAQQSKVADSENAFDWQSRVRFFVLGVQKGGTTSLYSYMGQHPQIRRVVPKETRCFLANYTPYDPLCERYFGKMWYGVKNDTDMITGDFSPGYIYGSRAIPRIMSAYPNSHFIVSLRNPIERALSQYKMHVRNQKFAPNVTFESLCIMDLEILRNVGLLSHWVFPQSFDDSKEYTDEVLQEMYLLASVNETKFASTFASEDMMAAWGRLQSIKKAPSRGIIWAGLYAFQLNMWFDAFPRERFLVISLEEMARDTPSVMRRIHEHLGLPYVPLSNTTALNTAGNSESTQISDTMRQILIKLYRSFDQVLKPLLKDEKWDLPWTL